MSKVFIVKDAGHSYGEAKRYGELRFVFKEVSYPFLNIDRLNEIIDLALVEAEADDRLLLAGPLLLNTLTTLKWVKKFGTLKLLLFDAKSEHYVERVLEDE